MIIRMACIFVASCALLASFVGLRAAQEKPGSKVPATSSTPPSGAELFAQHCASCHGNDLKGIGSFPAPYRTPPDLTTLARRRGGKFPDAYVSNVLRNGVKLPAHGPAEMPVWGSDFEATDKLDKAQVVIRIKALTTYIKSLQIR